jgi:streptogramin lyase
MGDPNAGFVTHFGPAPNRPLIQIYKDSKCAGVQGVNSDAQGNVFFACLTTSTVCRIDAVNNSYICVSNEFLRNPFDVDTDSEGNVWVSDANAFTSPSYAVKLSNSLQFILAVKLPPPSRADVDNRTLPGTSAKAIVVDSFDNVWVSNWRGNSVRFIKFDSLFFFW